MALPVQLWARPGLMQVRHEVKKEYPRLAEVSLVLL